MFSYISCWSNIIQRWLLLIFKNVITILFCNIIMIRVKFFDYIDLSKFWSLKRYFFKATWFIDLILFNAKVTYVEKRLFTSKQVYSVAAPGIFPRAGQKEPNIYYGWHIKKSFIFRLDILINNIFWKKKNKKNKRKIIIEEDI
jgi:hypothetical protein